METAYIWNDKYKVAVIIEGILELEEAETSKNNKL